SPGATGGSATTAQAATSVPTTIATTTIPLAAPPSPSATTATSASGGGVPLPCDPALLAAAAIDRFALPPGATAPDPRCARDWASALIATPNQGTVFAVFQVVQGAWEGRNLGTDGVCSDAGVPTDLYGPLNCAPWEG